MRLIQALVLWLHGSIYTCFQYPSHGIFNTEKGGGIGAFRDEYEKENLLLISQLMKEAGKLLSWKNKTKIKKLIASVYLLCSRLSVPCKHGTNFAT